MGNTEIMIITGYSIYLLAVIFLVTVVGRKLHRDGSVWLEFLFDGHPLGTRLNNLLLTGYYLANLGLAFFMMTNWDFSVSPILEAMRKTGANMLILSYLHFQNIVAIYIFNHLKILSKWKV